MLLENVLDCCRLIAILRGMQPNEAVDIEDVLTDADL